jgi:NADH-quinone oxidoreductase subunit H
MPNYILFTIPKIMIMVGFLLNVGGILTWVDRRQSAMIQDRVGPNRAVIKIGKFELRLAGLLHPAADGVKLIFKEDFMPPNADKLLFSLAPILSMIPVFCLLAVIPFGDTICPDALFTKVGGVLEFPSIARSGVCTFDPRSGLQPIDMQIASLDVGILFIFAMAGQGIVSSAISGWASDNKFSLMGALRASSQMVSYEVTMGLSIIGALMIYGTVRLADMVRWQGEHAWGIFLQPVAFFIFFAALVAESKRIPFDLPEAESELVSGYFTEYSGMKFGMFMTAEYMEVVTSSMLLVTIFLGGWALPFVHRDGLTIAFGETTLAHVALPHLALTVIGLLAFFAKTLVLCWIQCFIRWSLPRFRYDQLMKLCWKILLPVSLANIFVTGVVWLLIDMAPPSVGSLFQLAGDVTQALVAGAVTFLVGSAIVGLTRARKKDARIVGQSAELTNKFGKSPISPMQA